MGPTEPKLLYVAKNPNRNEKHTLSNSRTQLVIVEFGTTTRAGKASHLLIMVPRKVTIWTVLPCHNISRCIRTLKKEGRTKPISSARIQCCKRHQLSQSQFTPSICQNNRELDFSKVKCSIITWKGIKLSWLLWPRTGCSPPSRLKACFLLYSSTGRLSKALSWSFVIFLTWTCRESTNRLKAVSKAVYPNLPLRGGESHVAKVHLAGKLGRVQPKLAFVIGEIIPFNKSPDYILDLFSCYVLTRPLFPFSNGLREMPTGLFAVNKG